MKPPGQFPDPFTPPTFSSLLDPAQKAAPTAIEASFANTTKFLKKVGAGVLFAIGGPIVVLAGFGLFDASEMVRQLSILIMVIGLPPTGLAAWLLWSLWQQNRRDRSAQQIANQKQLQTTFFRLLQANNGTISLLQFAMESGLPGDAAKAYLQQQAQVFDAAVEVSTAGNLLYCFEVKPEIFKLEESP